MKRKQKMFLCCLGVFLLVAGVALCFGQSTVALNIKRTVHPKVLQTFYTHNRAETKGLAKDFTTTLYINGAAAEDWEYDPSGDMKRTYRTADVTRLVNYADGYRLDFPAGTDFDFSLSKSVTEARGEGYEFTVSLEKCPYYTTHSEMTEGLARLAPQFEYKTGLDQYIGYYQSRFLLNKTWQKNNRVTVSEPRIVDAAGYKAYQFHAVLNEMPADKYDAYSYIYICTGRRKFLRIMVKYRSEDPVVKSFLPTMLKNFARIERRGKARNITDFAPILPENWTLETQQVYQNIVNGDLSWGIYTTDVYNSGMSQTIPALEEKLDYTFPVVLSYVHSVEDFPLEFMNINWQKGRIVELTYQLTENNNEDMLGHSPALDLYRGINEETVRNFARQAKEFGHPFLFRFCNEMNSDWTSYGGVVNMADPDVFVQNWRTVYRIFEEEGVNNCIWIYNPNDRNAPPNRWNDSVTYYPGNEYVQMIGVTGYNNGTYYTQWAEEWREFDEIYDHIQNLYQEVYGAFPWIITEFSSSSVGGDKAAWIENMFEHINKYPNIKIAVWFSSADWDSNGNVARPYWLDETPRTTEAFRKGLEAYKGHSLIG